ncbi:ABC transporter substrate-binding protein [Jeotgalibacillus marinus]|uniref:ABC transporter substrate-binding protein n=1 Tax=Jeotgalibacillus marinus TaxID=86667 RepID=A0ABV3Q5C8_9BACL
MKKNSLISILISLMIVVSACSSTPESNAGNDNNSQKANSGSKKDTVVVGVENGNAPFSYIDEKGDVTGVDVDIIKSIAEAQGLEVDFRPMNFSSIVPSLQTEQIDAAISSTSLAMTSERSEQVDFSEWIMADNAGLASKKGSNIEKINDIKKGDVLSVKTGSTAENMAELLAEETGATIRRFDTTDKVLQDVINGQSDVAIESKYVLYDVLWKDRDYGIQLLNGDALSYLLKASYGEGDGPTSTATNSTAMAVKKGNTELLRMINEGLKTINENQVMSDIEKKWNLAISKHFTEENWDFVMEIDPHMKELFSVGDGSFSAYKEDMESWGGERLE